MSEENLKRLSNNENSSENLPQIVDDNPMKKKKIKLGNANNIKPFICNSNEAVFFKISKTEIK
jgi:hypothetical protein